MANKTQKAWNKWRKDIPLNKEDVVIIKRSLYRKRLKTLKRVERC